MGEERERDMDRADEPRTYANKVPTGASSGNVHMLVWLESLCIMEWLNILAKYKVNNQGS